MQTIDLVFRELRFRRLSFSLTLLSVTVAVAVLVAAQALMRSDEIQTKKLLDHKCELFQKAIGEREDQVAAAGRELNDEIRRQMLGLGFNVLIVPESQDLSELHLSGALSATMPESYVDDLANSRIISVNHLLPTVTGRIQIVHGDHRAQAIVQGTRGEVPIMHRGSKKPLLEAVPAGKAVLGSALQQELSCEVGETIHLLDENFDGQFEVARVHSERGSADDVTVWINLAEAQQLLGLENLIHAILALECECAGDRISQIRQEITSVLPGTKVVEKYSKALARAEARAKVKTSAERALQQERDSGAAALDAEKQMRWRIEQQHTALANILVPCVMVACAVWIIVMALSNVRQRTAEIGIFSAIGLLTKQIFFVFLARYAIIGLIGGLLGALVGLVVGVTLGGTPVSIDSLRQLCDSKTLLTLLLTAPLGAAVFSIISSWLPIMHELRKDPAEMLNSE